MESVTEATLAGAISLFTATDLAVIFFTYVAASQLLFVGLLRFARWEREVMASLWLVLLGAGPVVITALLLAFYLFLPGQSPGFYRWGPVIALGIWAIPAWGQLKRYAEVLRAVPDLWRVTLRQHLVGLVLLAILAVYFYPSLRMTLIYPFDGNDKLQYAMWGEIVYREGFLVSYHAETPHPKTGFLTRPHHAPLFALLHTWNWLWSGNETRFREFIVKANPLFFTLAFLAAFPVMAGPDDRRRFVLPGIAICLIQPAFYTAASSHIDALRLYTVTAALMIFLLIIRHRLRKFGAALLLGVALAAATLVHLSALVPAALLLVACPGMSFRNDRRQAAIGTIVLLFAFFAPVGGYYGYRSVANYGLSEEAFHQETRQRLAAFMAEERTLIEGADAEEELGTMMRGLETPVATPSDLLRRFFMPEHQADRLSADDRPAMNVRYREARSFAGKFFDPYLYNPILLLLIPAVPFFLLERGKSTERTEWIFLSLFALIGALLIQGTRGYTNYRYVYILLGPAAVAVVAFIDRVLRFSSRRLAVVLLGTAAVLLVAGPVAITVYFRDPVGFSSRQWEIRDGRLQGGHPHFPPAQSARALGWPDDGRLPSPIESSDRIADLLGYAADQAFSAFFLGQKIRALRPGRVLDTHLEDHYHYYARRFIYSWRDPRINFLDRDETIARVRAGRIGHGMIFSPTLDPRLSHRWLTRTLGIRYLLVQSDQLMQFVFVDHSRFFANLDLVATPLINLRNTVVLYELRDESAIEWEKAL